MTDTIRLSDRLELTPTLTPGWYVLRQSGAVVGANLPQSAADALIAACNPPRYDLPPGVIHGSDGKFYAPGDVVRTLPDEMWTAYFSDGKPYRGHVGFGRWFEVRPTAANPIKPLPESTFPLPDGTLACFRRDAAKLREAGMRVRHTDDGAESNPSHDHIWPDQVMRVEFPPTPKTERRTITLDGPAVQVDEAVADLTARGLLTDTER